MSNLRVSRAEGGRRVSESDLRGRLANPNAQPAEGDSADDEASDATQAADAASRPLAETDYALFEALNMLKGMSLVRPRRAS